MFVFAVYLFKMFLAIIFMFHNWFWARYYCYSCYNFDKSNKQLIGLGPNVIAVGTFITLGSNSYYRWDLYYTRPFITLVPSTNVTFIVQKEYRVELNLIKQQVSYY